MSTVQHHTHPNAAPSGQILAAAKRNFEIEELDAAIGKLNRQMNSCNYQLMLMLREFDERGGWHKWGFTNCVSWLCWRCDLSANAARDKMRVAHALKPLPEMSKAFESGRLSYSKVRSLTRIATVKNEEELIAMALNCSAAHVESHCRQRKNTSVSSTTVANNAHANRSLRLWRNEQSGTMTVSIELSAEEGELFQQAVDKASFRLSAEAPDVTDYGAGEKADSKTSWSAQQADAAMLMVRDYLSGAGNVGDDKRSDSKHCDSGGGDSNAESLAPVTSSSADRFQVVVHVDETALTNAKAKSEKMNGASELPLSTVRRLCCDGSIIPIVENAKGQPLSVGRKVRTITTAIRRALWARDRGCVFPGCHCKRYVDGHHIKHWADGGETSLDNLVLLCTRHHRLVHEGGYTIEVDQNLKRFFRRPDGKGVPECGYRRDDWEDDFSENVAAQPLLRGARLIG